MEVTPAIGYCQEQTSSGTVELYTAKKNNPVPYGTNNEHSSSNLANNTASPPTVVTSNTTHVDAATRETWCKQDMTLQANEYRAAG